MPLVFTQCRRTNTASSNTAHQIRRTMPGAAKSSAPVSRDKYVTVPTTGPATLSPGGGCPGVSCAGPVVLPAASFAGHGVPILLAVEVRNWRVVGTNAGRVPAPMRSGLVEVRPRRSKIDTSSSMGLLPEAAGLRTGPGVLRPSAGHALDDPDGTPFPRALRAASRRR